MKSVVFVAFLLVACGAFALAASPTYTLRPVAGSEDAVQCAKDKGKAALVAEISPDGALATEWLTFCLLPATK